MAKNKSTLILDAKDKTGRAFKSANANLKGFASSAQVATGAIAALAGGAGIGLLIKNSLDAGEALVNVGTKLGATTAELSALQFAATQGGVSVQNFNLSMQRLSRRVSEAAVGTGEAVNALKELGLEARVVNRLSLEDKFKAVGEALKGIENPTDRLRLAFKLFDTEGVQLLQVTKDGAAGIQEMTDRALELGIVFDDRLALAAKNANDALDETTRVVRGRLNVAFAEAAPAIEAISKVLTNELAQLDLTKMSEAVVSGLEKIVQAVALFADGIEGIITTIDLAIIAGNKLEQSYIQVLITLLKVKDAIPGTDDYSALTTGLELALVGVKEEGRQLTDELEKGLFDKTNFERANDLIAKIRESMEQTASAATDVNSALITNKDTLGALKEIGDSGTEAAAGLDAFVEKLRDQGEASRKTARELAIYKAEQSAIKAGLVEYLPQIRAVAAEEFDRTANLKTMRAVDADLNELFKERSELFRGLKTQYTDILGSEQGLAEATQAANEQFEKQQDALDELVNMDLDTLFDENPELFSGVDKEAEAMAEQVGEIWDNMVENMQREFSDTIYDALFEDGISSFSDFGDALVDIWKRMIAEMVAAWLVSGITGLFKGAGFAGFGGGGIASVFGGLGASSGGIGSLFGGGATAAGLGAGFVGGPAGAIGTAPAGVAYGGSIAAGLGAGFVPGPAGASLGASLHGGAAGAGGFGLGALGPLAIGAFGFSRMRSAEQERQQRRAIAKAQFDAGGFASSFTAGNQFLSAGGGAGFAQLGGNIDGQLLKALGATGGSLIKDDAGNVFAEITSGLEKAQAALASFSDETFEYYEKTIVEENKAAQALRARGEGVETLGDIQQRVAADVAASIQLGTTYQKQSTAAIVESFGTIETTAAGVSKALEDGFLSAAEISENALEGLSAGALNQLLAIQNAARGAAVQVAAIGRAGGRGGGGDVNININTLRGSQGGGKATGGISAGPLSGFQETLHGREAVIPLGDGNQIRAPIIVESGGDAALMAQIRRLAAALEVRNRRAP